MDKNKLISELKRDEDVRSTVYLDSEGIATIGVGRNLVDRGLSDDEIEYLLRNDIVIAFGDALKLFPSFATLTDARQRALVNMSFNLGIDRLGKFRKMRAAIQAGDWDKAADEMLDSKWACQVGPRAYRLSQMMREG